MLRRARLILAAALGLPVFLAGCGEQEGPSASAPEATPPVVVSREIVEFDSIGPVTEIALRTPWPWYVADVRCGQEAPRGWPAGEGLTVRLHQHPETYQQWKDGDYEILEITVMSGDYAGTADDVLTGKAPPASLLQEWPDRRAYIWVNRPIETWASYEDDIRAALTVAINNDFAARDGNQIALGQAHVSEIHINTAPDDKELPHGTYREGNVTDRLTGQTVTFSLHFMHPLFGHLEGMDGRDVLAVHTDRVVAIVPLEDLLPFKGE